MRDGKSCIICQGRHEDHVAMWPCCRVAKLWMELLDMLPTLLRGTRMARQKAHLPWTHGGQRQLPGSLQLHVHCLSHVHRAQRVQAWEHWCRLRPRQREGHHRLGQTQAFGRRQGSRPMSRELTDRGKFGNNIMGPPSACQSTSRRKKASTPAASRQTCTYYRGGPDWRTS